RDLECVEHAHLNLFNKIGQSPGHANKAHLTLLLQRQGRLQCTIFLELPPREASVKLDQVEIVRLHSPQALLQAGADVFGGVDVFGTHRCSGHAATFGCEEVLGSPGGNEASDQIFALPLVDGRVDEVDAGIQNRVE